MTISSGIWTRAFSREPGPGQSPSLERIRTERITLLVIFGLGAILRFSLLGQESFWYDEAWSIATAGAATLGALLEKVSSDSHPALYFVLLREWMKVFGDSEAATRALSALFGAVTPVLVFFLGRALSLPSIACLLGSFLYALNTQAIWYSQEARMYSLISLLGTLHLALTALVIRPRRLRETSWPLSGAWWVTGVLCLYTHYFGFFFLAADAAAIGWTALVLSRPHQPSRPERVALRRSTAKKLLARSVAAAAGWAAAAFPLLLIVVSRLRTGHYIDWLDGARIGWETPWRILGGLVVGEQISTGPWPLREATAGVFLVVLLCPVLAMLGGRCRRISWGLPLLFSFTLLAIPTFISVFRPIIMEGTRYVSIAGAPLCLAGGAGLAVLFRGRWFARGLLALSLCLLLVSDAAYLSSYYRAREKRMWREAVLYVDSKDLSAPMVAVPDHMTVVLGYYERGGRPIIPWSEHLRDPGAHRRVWVLAEGLPHPLAHDSWKAKSSVLVSQAFSLTAVTVTLLERTLPEEGAGPPGQGGILRSR